MWADMGWREVLLTVCALLAVYVVFVFFQINRLKREESPLASLEPSLRPTVDAYEAVMKPSRAQRDDSPAPLAAAESAQTTASAKWETSLFSEKHKGRGSREPQVDEVQFKSESRQKMIAIEQEVDQLRKEVGRLRAEILLLREARQKSDKPSPPSPRISSFYNDAMQMAERGESMENISQLCGISRAEAELVKALVKDRNK